MNKVVVIGGGFAGSLVAKKLEKDFDVTLIDTKDYFEFTPGILRSIVEPKHVRRIQVLHSHYLRRAKVIVGHVKDVTKDFVRLNGKKVSFDYLVVSSGSTYNLPFKEQDIVIATRANHLKHKHNDLEKAEKIVIIGGGAVGVELAGEILGEYSKKEVALVHSSSKLIERNSPEASKYAEKILKSMGAKLIFGERVNKVNKSFCMTDKGRKIDADMIFLCTGIKPNFELLKKFDNVLNKNNQVRVNEFMQVNGFENIFAAGDITGVEEEKTAQNAEKQARIVARNICRLEAGEELVGYVSKKRTMVLSLGKWRGIIDSSWGTWRGFIPSLVKRAVEIKEMWKKRKL